MKGHLQLSRDEAQKLDAILTSVSARAKYPFSLSYLLQKWGDFVAQVDKGFEGSIYEYTNDLSIRDVLEEILLKAPPSLHDKIMQRVQPWDDRLHEVTRKASRPLAPGVPPDAPSWWLRIPKKLARQLEDDFRSEGILE
jgi:hypothetical protein